MGHFFAVDCMIWWVTTTLTHWGQVYIDYGKGLLLARFQAVTWNWYCHINEIRTQWVEDHSIHRMYIYSWNLFLIVLNTAIKDFEFWHFLKFELYFWVNWIMIGLDRSLSLFTSRYLNQSSYYKIPLTPYCNENMELGRRRSVFVKLYPKIIGYRAFK